MRNKEKEDALGRTLERDKKRVELYEQKLAQAEAVVKSVRDQLARAKSDVSATSREIRGLRAWVRRLEEAKPDPALRLTGR